MKVIVKIETDKPEVVAVYLREILKHIMYNKHFSISNYTIENDKEEKEGLRG